MRCKNRFHHLCPTFQEASLNHRRATTALVRRRRATSASTAVALTATPAPSSTTRIATRQARSSAPSVRRSSPTWWLSKTTDAFTQSPSATSAWSVERRSACPLSSYVTDGSTPKRSLSPACCATRAFPASQTCGTIRRCTRTLRPTTPRLAWTLTHLWTWTWGLSFKVVSQNIHEKRRGAILVTCSVSLYQ